MMNGLKTFALCSGVAIAMWSCGGMVDADVTEENTEDENTAGITPSAYATNGTHLRAFRLENAARSLSNVAISGLASGEEVRGLDFRPATGELFAITNFSRLYVIDPATAAATQRSTDGVFALATTDDSGFDFNPVVDRIRVVGTGGQNLRLNPINGALAATDGALNGGATSALAAAYTNSFAGTPAAPTTTLYVIGPDPNGKPALFIQNPPNAGTTVRVGALNIGTITGRSIAFDIVAPNTGYVLATRGPGAAQLYQIDLTTAAATSIGFVSSLGAVRGLALVPAARPAATAFVTDGANLRGITLEDPAFTLTSVAISGLQAGESVRGMDFRPATGELFAVTDQSRLYVIDRASGAAVQRGVDGVSALGVSDDAGFDFNPVVDRIRLVQQTGSNLRLNPTDGAIAATDGNINGAALSLRAAAYTNSFLGAAPTSTTLLVADYDAAGIATLFTQTPPNAGTTVAVGTLDLGAPLGGALSFDIQAPNTGYIVANRGASASLYRVDLSTAATTLVGSFSGTAETRGLAIIPTAQ